MKLNITTEHFLGLVERGLTLDHIFILKLVEENYDVNPLCEEWERINGLKKALFRKGFISKEETPTIQGKEVLGFISSIKNKKLIKTKIPEPIGFNEWWLAFPSTDCFEYKGQSYKGARGLRVNKDVCKALFEKIVDEGEYKPEQLIAALEYDVIGKKEESIKKRENKLSYMQNSATYLRQRSFEPFIELVNQQDINPKQEENFDGINI